MKHYVIQLGPVTLRRYNLTCARPRAALRSTWTYDVLHGEVVDPVSNAVGTRSTATRIGRPFPNKHDACWSQADYTSTGRKTLAFYPTRPQHESDGDETMRVFAVWTAFESIGFHVHASSGSVTGG